MNPLSNLPTSSSPIFPPKDENISDGQEKTEKPIPIANVGIKTINHLTKETDSFAQTKPIAAKQTPWSALIKFFTRRFAKITPTEQQQATEIRKLLEDVGRYTGSAYEVAIKATRAEKEFANQSPSTDSINMGEQFIYQTSLRLRAAKTSLEELKKHEATAKQLAENHSTFESLPKKIEKLEETINYMTNRLAITQALLNFEIAIKAYYDTETWKNFEEIKMKRSELTLAIQENLRKELVIKDDPALKKYVNKDVLSGLDSLKIVINLYPGLTGHTKRLFDDNIKIHDTIISKKPIEEKSERVISNSIPKKIKKPPTPATDIPKPQKTVSNTPSNIVEVETEETELDPDELYAKTKDLKKKIEGQASKIAENALRKAEEKAKSPELSPKTKAKNASTIAEQKDVSPELSSKTEKEIDKKPDQPTSPLPSVIPDTLLKAIREGTELKKVDIQQRPKIVDPLTRTLEEGLKIISKTDEEIEKNLKEEENPDWK